MRKRFNFGRLSALALALTLITSCLMGGTLAKYTSEAKGTGKATAAKWSFKVNNGETTFDAIDLGATGNRDSYTAATVKDGVIAPGTSGKFDIVIDGSGSEVGIDYAIKLTKATSSADLPSGLVFSTEEITGSNSGTAISNIPEEKLKGTINYSATADAMKKTVTIYWKWNDAADNDNEYQDKDYTIDISVTGTQVAPTAPTS